MTTGDGSGNTGPIGLPGDLNGIGGGNADGMALIRDLMKKNGGKGKQSISNIVNNIDDAGTKDFEKIFKGVSDQINDMKILIKKGVETNAPDSQIASYVDKLKAAADAADILIKKSNEKFDKNPNSAEAARWVEMAEKIGQYLDSNMHSDVKKGKNPFATPTAPKTPKEKNEGGGGGRGRRDPKNPIVSDIEKLIKEQRAIADRFLAGKKGFGGDTPSRETTEQGQANLIQKFTEEIRANSGNMTADDENALIQKFTYAIRRFEIALREDKASKGMDVAGAMSMGLGTLGGSKILNKLMFDDPMRYRFAPAMQAMGTTGQMGEALSGAITAQRTYQVEINQNAFNSGLGMMAAGGAGMALARGGGGMMGGKMGKLGAGLMIGGALTSVAGGTGLTSSIYDSMAGLFGGVTSQEVFQTQLASQFNKPETLIARNEIAKNATRAYGMGEFNAKGATSFGTYLNNAEEGRSSQTGNALFDKLSTPKFMGADFEQLGFSGNKMGEYMAELGGSVRGKKGEQAIALTRQAVGTASAFGGDPSQMIQMYAAAQQGGGTNLQSMVKQNMTAASDKDGQLDQFAINVIAPAVGRVTQSLALRNVSMSADKLNEQVSSLYREFSVGGLSGSNLGKQIASNPEMLTQMLGNFGQATQASALTEVGYYDMMRMGLDPTEYIRGGGASPEGLKKYAEASYNYFDLGNSMEGEGANKRLNNQAYITMAQKATANGLDPQQVQELYVNMSNNGGKLNTGNKPNLDQAAANMDKTARSNLDTITSNPIQDVAGNMTEQENVFEKTVQGIQDKIKDAQDAMKTYIHDPAIIKKATQGMDSIIAEMYKQMGIPNPHAVSTALPPGEAPAGVRVPPHDPNSGFPETMIQKRASVAAVLEHATPAQQKVFAAEFKERKIDWKDGGAGTTAAAALIAEAKTKITAWRMVNGVPAPAKEKEGKFNTAAIAQYLKTDGKDYEIARPKHLGNPEYRTNAYKTLQSSIDVNKKDNLDTRITDVAPKIGEKLKDLDLKNPTGDKGILNRIPEIMRYVEQEMTKEGKTPKEKQTAMKGLQTYFNAAQITMKSDKSTPQMKAATVSNLASLFGVDPKAANANGQTFVTKERDAKAQELATTEYKEMMSGRDAKARAAYSVLNSRVDGWGKPAAEGTVPITTHTGETIQITLRAGMKPEDIIDLIKKQLLKK